MADLSNLTYASLQTAIGDWLARSDLSSNVPDFILLFENEVNRTIRTRQMEKMSLLYPNPVNQWAVSSVGASTDGNSLVKITVTTTSTAQVKTGDEISVSNVGGTNEANNTWIATALSSLAFTLQNSAFVNAYTSGGTVTSISGQASLPSDYLTWRRVTWTGTPNRVLEYVQPDILRIYHPIVSSASLNLDADFPTMFTIEGSNLIIRPIDGTALEFDYYQAIPALSAQGSTGTNWLLTAYPDAYLAGSLTEAYVFQKDWDQAGMWKQRRDDILDRLTRVDQKSRGPSHIKVDMRGIVP